MHCISHSVCSKLRSKRSWRILFSLLRARWPHALSESLNSVLSYKFHSSTDITLHKRTEVSEEGLAAVLVVEIICLAGLCELGHLKLLNGETVSINCINNFTSLSVTVWLDHCKGPLGSGFELSTGEEVSVFYQFELSGIDVKN